MTILNDNVLPLQPNPTTGTTMPLVTASQYVEVTGDQATSIGKVEDLIAEAVEDLSHECRRTLTYGQYTEAQYLYPNGMVFPSATPIDVSKAISSTAEGNLNIYNPDVDSAYSSIVQGDGVWVGWFSPLPWMPFYTGVVPPQTILTYYGGFVNTQLAVGNLASHGLPSRVKRMICTIVAYRANPVLLPGMPRGAKSMSVGGVSISGSLYSLMDRDPELKRLIRRWRHPQGGYAWQS